MTEPPFPHNNCVPGQHCGQCKGNVAAGFAANHPGNDKPRRERGGASSVVTTSGTCPHLGERVASDRNLRECRAGIAPKIHGKSLVVCCNVVNEGEYQLGKQCGPGCDGFPKSEVLPELAIQSASAYAPMPVDPGAPWPVPRQGMPKYVYRTPPYEPIRPSSERAVCTVVVGESAERNHELTAPSHRAYAAKNGADYIVLRGQTQEFPVYEKYRYREVVVQYPEGTLCLDASDTHILSHCPSIWDEVPAGKVGMTFDHLHTRNRELVAWGNTQLHEVCKLNGTTPHPASLGTYHNSGVWFGRPEQAKYWTPPPVGFVGHWCDEETWCRHQLHALGIQLHELDWRWNWCWANDRTMSQLNETRPYIIHLAGMDNPSTPDDWKLGGGAVRTQMLTMLHIASGTVP